MISEYYYHHQRVRRKHDVADTHNPDILQKFVEGNLAPLLKADADWFSYFYLGGHLIPQYDFVSDANDNKLVQHVLKFENLVDDFYHLVKMYGDDVSLWEIESKNTSKKRATEKKLTADNYQPALPAGL